jgi:hypothetical protein
LRAPATNNTDILPIATRPSAGACLQHRAVIVDGDRRMARFGGHQGQRPLHLPQVRAGKFTVFDTVHRVLACADDTSKVAESDNVNNCRASTTTITIQQRTGVRPRAAWLQPAASRGRRRAADFYRVEFALEMSIHSVKQKRVNNGRKSCVKKWFSRGQLAACW